MTASIMGIVGYPREIAYCASKGGVIMLAKAMALEFAPANIRVNCVAPGFVITPMVEAFFDVVDNSETLKRKLADLHAFKRFGKPEEIAQGVLFLASDDSSFVTGTVLTIDGGYTYQ